ncbi:MAG: hypothetical protein KC505_02905 [Myxococcales bacterium]|nr:hypothetical protein [Myxococcales bacterium]USN51710.1 MAG: hypothetical protein H6731_04690 [Myxococcales bacterium]
MSIFLPWLCISGFITLIGLRCGGIIHIIFSLVASFEVLKVASIKRQSYDAHRLLLLPTLLKKTSLKYLFYGFSSMSISTFNLFDFLSQTKQTNLIEVRGGFYLCLLSGVGIFVCGLERFCFQNKPNSAPS